MEKKLALKDYAFVGSLLFGLFFGAGNLIFPLNLGQNAGSQVWWANLGFLITGIGLPFLGILAIGVSGQKGILEVSQRVSVKYGLFFTTILYLVIGPFFALPRLASTSFEIALKPFLPSAMTSTALLFFSLIFFLAAALLAVRPAKILDYVGKFLNPIFLILLFSLILIAFLRPLGDFSAAPIPPYTSNALITGLKEGYNTLDALASLAFGIIIVTSLQQMGVKKTSSLTKATIKSGLVALVVMGIIYTCLSLMGTMSLGQFAPSENGGIALTQIADYYFGSFGKIILALLVILACFKTAIGLLTAFSETFSEMYPKISFKKWLVVVTILPAIFANVGLTQIINAAVPVLQFVYPLAITLILLVLTSQLFHHAKIVYQLTTIATFLAAIFEGLNALPPAAKNFQPVRFLLAFAQHLPLFSLGLSWLPVALLGFFIALFLRRYYPEKITL